MLGSSRPAVSHGQLHLPKLAEVVQIPSGGNAAHACRIRHRSGRQPGLRLAQGLHDQIESGVGKPLWNYVASFTGKSANLSETYTNDFANKASV